MEKNNNGETNSFLLYTEEEGRLKVLDIVHIVLKNWYWFLLSGILCVGFSVLYVRMTPKTYIRTASILIKDDERAGGITEAINFSDLGMFKFKNNIYNEMLILKSERLITEAVNRLRLDVDYKVRDGLRNRELYTRSPITVTFIDIEDSQSHSFSATILPDGKVCLSDFRMRENNYEYTVNTALNDTVNTPIGRMLINPTLYWSDEYLEKSISVSKNRVKNVAQIYRNALQISLAYEMATIMNLTFQDESIARAEDFINTLIAVYNEDVVNDKNQVVVNTSKFINERLMIIEKELGVVDSNIASYKSENQLTDLSSEIEIYLEEGSLYNREGLRLENQLSLAKYISQYIKDSQNNFNSIPANIGIIDVNIENAIDGYNTLLLKRARLILNSSENSPVIMDINNSLNSMKQNIVATIDNYILSIDLKMKSIKQQEFQANQRISSMPNQQKNIVAVGREQKIKEELYLYLLGKREENAVTQVMTISNARIVDLATGSDSSVAPDKTKILVIALMASIAIPLLILLLAYALNTKIRSLKDLDGLTAIPILGEIPERKKSDRRELLVHESGNESISEAFRIIRTNIDFMQIVQKSKQVILFTSSTPSVGKTFISSNLSISFAMTGKKVLLIDLDIRKGRHLKPYSRDKHEGVTNYLAGKVDNVDAIIHKADFDNRLDIIYSGPIPPNPAELLLNENLERLIAELKTRYDYILIDNVPAGIVADSFIVNRVVDMTIYIVRAGDTNRNQLSEIEKYYTQKRFNNMSLILNATELDQINYGYGYGYGDRK